MDSRRSAAAEQFILNQKHGQKELIYLRQLIFSQLPDAIESLKWNLPFYAYKNKLLLYFNPKPDKLIMAFVDGVSLPDSNSLFAKESKKLKSIRHIYYTKDIAEQAICEAIQEAALFVEQNDKTFMRAKK